MSESLTERLELVIEVLVLSGACNAATTVREAIAALKAFEGKAARPIGKDAARCE